MKRIPSALLLLATSLVSLVGCRSAPDAPTSNSWVATTLEITGSPGARFAGYYLVGDRKIPISGSAPKTVVDFGITGCELRKRDPQETLWLGARNQGSVLNFQAPPGTVGLKAKLSGGWNAKVIKK